MNVERDIIQRWQKLLRIFFQVACVTDISFLLSFSKVKKLSFISIMNYVCSPPLVKVFH